MFGQLHCQVLWLVRWLQSAVLLELSWQLHSQALSAQRAFRSILAVRQLTNAVLSQPKFELSGSCLGVPSSTHAPGCSPAAEEQSAALLDGQQWACLSFGRSSLLAQPELHSHGPAQ